MKNKNMVFQGVICILMLIIPIMLSAQQSQYYTGDGGRGIRLGVIEPRPTGLPRDQEHLPALIQSVLSSNITRYSAINVVNRQTLEEIFGESLDHIYEDNLSNIRIGNITPPDTWVAGSVIRTSAGYTLQLNVVTGDRQIASHSSNITVTELDNHSAIQRASQDLLRQMGVQLTQAATRELEAAATQNQIVAQVNLAQGVTAQRQGTEVAALSYYFQAAALDPTLFEAVNRSNVTVANIRSGNIGADVRNDIAWRNAWVAKLRETEEFFYALLSSADSPYTLFYSTGIQQGNVNYQRETVDLSFSINIRANGAWFSSTMGSVETVTQAVYDGLVATGRASSWQLQNWPNTGVTNTNPYNRQWNHNLQITFEILNERNRVIGSRYNHINWSYSINRSSGNRFITDFNRDSFHTIDFSDVNANEITDNLTITIRDVNNVDPNISRFPLRALSGEQFNVYRNALAHLRIENGVVRGFNKNVIYGSLDSFSLFPIEIWGETDFGITAIGDRAIENAGIIGVVIIPQHTISIGSYAFANNNFSEILFPNSVTSIGSYAFFNNPLTEVTIPSSVKIIGEGAFIRIHQTYRGLTEGNEYIRGPIKISIGDNVEFGHGEQRLRLRDGSISWESISAFGLFFREGDRASFNMFYERNEKRADTYTRVGYNWTLERDLEEATRRFDERNRAMGILVAVFWIAGIILASFFVIKNNI